MTRKIGEKKKKNDDDDDGRVNEKGTEGGIGELRKRERGRKEV